LPKKRGLIWGQKGPWGLFPKGIGRFFPKKEGPGGKNRGLKVAYYFTGLQTFLRLEGYRH